jgi:hypothetical protein
VPRLIVLRLSAIASSPPADSELSTAHGPRNPFAMEIWPVEAA